MVTLTIFLDNPVMGIGEPKSPTFLDHCGYHRFKTKLYVGSELVSAIYGRRSELGFDTSNLHLRTFVWYSSDWIDLDNFDDKEKGEGKGGEDKNQSAESEQVRKESRSWFREDVM